jgi:hypothetical protein
MSAPLPAASPIANYRQLTPSMNAAPSMGPQEQPRRYGEVGCGCVPKERWAERTAALHRVTRNPCSSGTRNPKRAVVPLRSSWAAGLDRLPGGLTEPRHIVGEALQILRRDTLE